MEEKINNKYVSNMLEQICKDNNINIVPLTDELRTKLKENLNLDMSAPQYTLDLGDGYYHIIYDNSETLTDIKKQYFIAYGIANVMLGRLKGNGRKESVDTFASTLMALALFSQYGTSNSTDYNGNI